MGTERRACGALAAVAALAACMCLLALLQANAAHGSSCGKTRVVRDYLAPLAKMPPVHPVPALGNLPFGPAGLSLEPGTELVVGGGYIGFRFRDKAVSQRRKLGWQIEATLMKVNAAGKVIGVLQSSGRRFVSVMGSNIGSFTFEVSSNPAYYRVDISIHELKTQRLLGSFSQYARAMRPRTDLRVQIEQPAVTPGQTARARLINLGTVGAGAAAYDFGFNVRRFDGARWVTVPDNPSRGRVPKIKQYLGPGTENRGCLRYLVPEGTPPGLYRFQSGELKAGFEVVAP